MKYVALIISLFLSSPATEDIVVVASADAPFENLSEYEISNIFLSKSKYTGDGLRVMPIELASDGQKEWFYEKISGKNLAQLNSYWTTLIFTGKGKPPKQYKKVQNLVGALKQNPEAITYISSSQVDPTMKVVFRFP